MSTKTFASILAFLALSGAPGRAQESRGTITGRVVDSSGAVLVAAEVRAVSKETGAVLNARTNDAGSYTLPYLGVATLERRSSYPDEGAAGRFRCGRTSSDQSPRSSR